MAFFKVFHATKATEEQHRELVQCLENIISTVFEKTGVPTCIRLPQNDTAVAFAGDIRQPKLWLELESVKYNKQHYIRASLDDLVAWNEWEHADRNAFLQNIAEYIAPRVNATIKTVIERIKHKSIRETVYKKDEDGRWVLLEDECEDHILIRPFLSESRTEETIEVYQI